MRGIFAVAAALAFACATSAPAAGEPPSEATVQAPGFDDTAREAVVREVAKAMRDGYVEPEIGARAADKIEHAAAAGGYDGLQPVAFALRLTTDLSEVAHDKHLRVFAPDSGRPPGLAPEPNNDSGIVRADRLAGNIGYVEIFGFPSPTDFKPALDRAMSALSSSRALIVDMRRDSGGSPQGVAYLVSYFVSSATPVHVMDLLFRRSGTTDYDINQTFTSPTRATFAGKPVYVLTSTHTFSGGEEFCYDLQTMRLAVLIGETTGGGANPGDLLPLSAGMSLSLPRGKARSPITGKNWEGVGVRPDIIVASDQALRVALEKLGRSSHQTDIAKLSRQSLFHFRDVAAPGTEAALRQLIGSAGQGAIDYEDMTPQFADVVRRVSATTRPLIAALGPIQSVAFMGPGWGNEDRFEVRFARGSQLWSIALTADGKISAASFTPAPPGPQ